MGASSKLLETHKRLRASQNGDSSLTEGQDRKKRLKISQEAQHGSAVSSSLNNSQDDRIVAMPTKWSIHHVFNAHFSDVEPVFSSDENYLFLSMGGTVQVFSMSTHRPIRSFQTNDSSHVTGLRLSPSVPERLFVLTSSGHLIQWDWELDRNIATLVKFQGVITFEVVTVHLQEKERTAIFSLRKKKNGRRTISVSLLGVSSQNQEREDILFESTKAIDRLKVVRQGQCLVASNSQDLIVGIPKSNGGREGLATEFTWREVSLPCQITSLDVREAPGPLSTATRKASSAFLTSIDIAIGESNGSILIYRDIINALHRNEHVSHGEQQGLPLFEQLHWHREAVRSICWSRDGNYIISGGRESVIVFWQLDSGRKNFLPHFPSSIWSMTISPSGKLYASRLSDNSIVVLSATEMEAIFTIHGLQLPLSARNRRTADHKRFKRAIDCTIPAVLHPQRPENLLIAIPAREDGNDVAHSFGNMSVLQTFNVRSGSHISRQALTRTNITVLNKGPEGRPIISPNILYLDISTDGRWLATVDSWTPHQKDVEPVQNLPLDDARAVHNHEEIFLKFWMWNDSTSLWELATRIDSPHFETLQGPVQVCCLVSRPGRHEFATFGADGMIRVWQPTARYAVSAKGRSRAGRPEQTWKCQTSIDMTGSTGFRHGKSISSTSMSFSEDGSVLAISTYDSVHLIDATRWEIHRTRSGMSLNSIISTKFLGRSLVLLSKESITVWDVVNDVLKDMPTPDLPGLTTMRKNHILLAVNSKMKTFAVATEFSVVDEALNKRHETSFGVAVYGTQSASALFQSAVANRPLCLLSDPQSGDYVVIDAAANLQRLTCHDEALQQSKVPADVSDYLKTGLENIFGTASQSISKPPQVLPSGETSRSISKNFETIFDSGPSFALPAVSVLFKDVVTSLVGAS